MSALPLELIWELEGLPAFDLPPELETLYGGPLGFDEPRLFANFVSTLDGVVAIPSLAGSNRLISGASSADRFVMGLLRACSDAVVLGAGTLAGSPRSLWTPERAYPDAGGAFAELRRRLGRPPKPELVVLSASGRIDPGHPALAAGALVLTTDAGEALLAGKLPSNSTMQALGEHGPLDPQRVTDVMHERGHRLILSEGGPHAIGPFLRAGLVDELFLTLSPLLLGRHLGEERLALVEGEDLLPEGPVTARLLGIRRSEDHVFLRYGFEG